MSVNTFHTTWPEKKVYSLNYQPPAPGEDEPPENPDDIPDVPPSNPVLGQSIISGNWSNPATWYNGVVPVNRLAIISTTHVVTYDLASTTVAGITIQGNGKLEFTPGTSRAITSTQNIVVNGILEMKPSSGAVQHTITFSGINEANVQGGGDNPLASDVGLWIMGNGRWAAEGTFKKGWTRATASVNSGATSMVVEDASGWRIGDEIFIVPMDTPSQNTADWQDAGNYFTDSYRPKFERRILTSVSGNTVGWSGGLTFNHPVVTSSVTSGTYGTKSRTWRPEVGNLSRNVKIQGTKDAGDDNHLKYHRTHVFLRVNVPQTIKNVGFQYTGPRKGSPRPSLISGRYGLHFHHCDFGTNGSIVENCAIYDSGNRCYVPHVSHGITIRDCIAFNSMQEGLWWDFQEITHNSLWQRNLIACMTQNGTGSNSRGVLLQIGDDNVAEDNVVVYGHSGDPNGGGGYAWDADSEGVWIFRRNMSHSCVTGLFVWQNTSFNHTIDDFDTFECYQAVFHGAYINSYLYTRGYHYKSLLDIKATSGNTTGVQFLDTVFDAGGREFGVRIHDSPIGGSTSSTNKFVRCIFRNHTVAAARLFTLMVDSNVEKQHKACDFIRCDTTGTPFILDNSQTYDYPGFNLKDGNIFRNQPISGQSYQIQRVGQQNVQSNISPFATTVYGTGTGLTGQYFLGSNFNTLQFTRVDSMIMYVQWSVDKRMSPFGVHHLVQGDFFSMRWTGRIEPQWSENHVFTLQLGGGGRLWINGNLVIDSWNEKSGNETYVDSAPIAMSVGTSYTIRIDHFNSTGSRTCQIFWKSPSMPTRQNPPQSQLYPI